MYVRRGNNPIGIAMSSISTGSDIDHRVVLFRIHVGTFGKHLFDRKND
jgi:hypothetical protein